MEAEEPDAWPLAGWRVVDLSTAIAGPYCAKMLADAGADVIKVERPDGGDPLRGWTASDKALDEGGDGVLFQFLNASKRSIALDPRAPEDRREPQRLPRDPRRGPGSSRAAAGQPPRG